MKDRITLDEIRHIADLSKIELDQTELESMRGHLEKMLGYFDTLEKADVSKVPPTAHVLDKVNVLRDDTVKPSMPREELLSNAPDADDGAYIVPRVVE